MTWQLPSYALLALVLVAGFGWYERRKPSARVVGLVAVLAALAVVGRLAFAAIPNVKPTTDIVLFAGYALGGVPGFAVGAISAVASNVFLGQGPWTAWQMAAWGAVGIGGALLARVARGRELGRVELAVACGLAGLAFGAFMDVYQWSFAARQDLPTYLAIAGTSLPYNLAHAFGNVAFCLLIGPVFVRSLRRYRRRFEISWPRPTVSRHRAIGGTAGAAVLALAIAVVLTTPAAVAATSSSRAVDYLERAQNRDGGFGGSVGQSSSQLVTGWSALGLAAAGLNPKNVERRNGKDVIAYLRRNSRQLADIGELQRTILVLRAAGISPRKFAGSNLLAKLRRSQGADGSWKSNVAFTAFGLLALRAAGEPAGAPSVRKAADYLVAAQAGEGGWGFVAKAPSDVDDTGAVLQALAAAGRRGSVTSAGARYLHDVQSGDGGWGQLAGRTSNAQSTSWAVQGLVAARIGLGTLKADPLAYLRRLQRRDGHFSYSATSDQTPVWVTAQALAAIRRKPFPLARVRSGKGNAKRAATETPPAEMSAEGGGGGTSDGDSGTALLLGGAALVIGIAAAVGWRVRHSATA
jgi:energy-coupling factor transport system substrate-specific component